ncbi:hypothetical protein AB0F36_14375 [Streptomyces sp. NPDC029080]|uniref:hypothetical protein n=1 Tax=Streptomyces sp. NPDC029080 TaxID=3155017 RepID=UPI0033FAAF16
MRTDDILDQIDDALHDNTVSGDAMRSRPAAEHEQRIEPRIWITSTVDDPDSGGWERLDGITSIDIQLDTADLQARLANVAAHLARLETERIRRAQEALTALGRAMAEAVRPAADEAVRAIGALNQTVQQPTTPPGRRSDRPAWQSPYGPPRRR